MSTENTPHIILPVEGAREGLRRRAVSQTEKLSRSVARLTSCDAPCVEYADEVLYEKAVIDDLLFYQHCRATLERCLAVRSKRIPRSGGKILLPSAVFFVPIMCWLSLH